MITVATEATSEPITLAEAKDWLNITGTSHDTTLTACIKAARKKVESLSGRSLVARTLELKLQEYDDSYIDLPFPEISAISSVKETDSEGTETTIASTDYSLTYNRLNYMGNGNAVKITYSTKANTEEFYKLAVKKQMAYDFRNQFTENGFDKEVLQMISTETLNMGY